MPGFDEPSLRDEEGMKRRIRRRGFAEMMKQRGESRCWPQFFCLLRESPLRAKLGLPGNYSFTRLME
jgi:hypothetical protein